jgi:hypothetical protein
MIILKRNETNEFCLTLSENIPTGTGSVCNLNLDYIFYFYDKNTKLTDTLILEDTSLNPKRYNQFSIDLTGSTSSFSTNGTYTYETYESVSGGATGPCLETGLVRLEGLGYPEEFVRESAPNSIYIRKNRI